MSRYSVKRTIIRSIEKGADLYAGIARIAADNHVSVGRVTGVGAVEKAVVAFYDQKIMEYSEISINQPMEIVSLNGNITLRDGKPAPHIHVVLSDDKGNGKGGHLVAGGTPVFACEVTLEEFDGPDLVREHDETTGLFLWKAQGV